MVSMAGLKDSTGFGKRLKDCSRLVSSVNETISHLNGFEPRLARHPEVQEKLYREILSQLPSEDATLEEKSIERMPYLRSVIKETLRMHPPAPMNARILNRPFELGGYLFPPSKLNRPFLKTSIILRTRCHWLISEAPA